MIKYNANPKGWKTNDCVVRAIALATNQSWDKVFTDLCEIAFKKKRMLNDPRVYEKYLSQLGWNKRKQPRFYTYEDGSRSTYKKETVDEFIINRNFDRLIQTKYDTYIIRVANHMTVVKLNEGKFDLFDIWDCGHRCVGEYWVKE